MANAKPTPGSVRVFPNDMCAAELKGAYLLDNEGRKLALVNSHSVKSQEICEANAELMAEAFNVLADTGMTPRQLAARREELLGALQYALTILQSYRTTHVGVHGDAIATAERTIANVQVGAA